MVTRMNGVVDRIEGDDAVVVCKNPGSGEIYEVYVDQKKLNCDFTERKNSEAVLQESEQKFRTIIDASPVPQCLVDDKQNITFLNKAFTAIFGYTLEDIPTVVDWWPKGYPDPEYRAWVVKTWHERVEKAKQTGNPFEPMEATLTCKNLSLRTVIVSATNLWEPFEQFLSVTLYDITERNKATAELQDINEKLRFLTQQQSTIFDASPVGIAIVVERTIVSANRTFCEMMGYPEKELINKSTRLVYPSQDAFEKFGREVYPCFIEGKISHSETDFRRKDGSLFTANVTGGTINPHDLSVGSIWIFEDISERKNAEARLRILSEAVEQSPVTIMITDLEGTIESVNPKFSDLTGYTAEEAVGQNTRILKSGQTSPEVYESLWSTITSGQVWEGDFLNKSKNGTLFWEHATISPLRDNNGAVTHYLTIKEDVTEKRNVMEQLIQSQKVETIGQLAGGIAHDFNNILSIISGYAYLMKLEIGKDSDQLPNIDQILSASAKAAVLTQGLLAYSRKQIMNPVNQDLNHVITAVGSLIARLIGEHIKFTVSAQGAPLPVCVDSLQIEQVMMNLATNARDAMPHGGTFTISTTAGCIVETGISAHGCDEVCRYAIITVADTGSGMSADIMQRIFDPFYTTKEVGKGTGLGMSIVMGIIKQNKGFITVHSVVGVGTTFTIYLPLVDADSNETEKDSDLELVAGGGTILVAEDEPAVRNYMVRLLTQYGYKVILAVDGQDAVDKYVEHKDEIDLLIFDMVMPNKSGKAACHEIRQMGAAVECLFVSGYAGDLIERQGELGAHAILLVKPIQPHVLLSKIEEILKK